MLNLKLGSKTLNIACFRFDGVSSIEPRPMYPVAKYQAPAAPPKTDARLECRPASEPARDS